MKTINAKSKTFDYDIIIGKEILTKLTKKLSSIRNHENLFIIIDNNVNKIYGTEIRALFLAFGEKVKFLVFNATEKEKTFAGIQKILISLMKNNFSRDTLLVSIGGGITGDAAGFASAIYMRGIPYVHVPTTLLAAVDSSIGGKTGVNLSHVKNIVGAFNQPELVFVDTKFFNTLPEEELICGIGEVLKYAFLTDKKFFNYFNKNIENILDIKQSTINRIVFTSANFKANIVMQDERESGLRKLLNLGHTFAHAIESVLNHKIKHGQAVIVGIAAANFLSNSLGLLPDKNLDESLELLEKFKNFITLPIVDFKPLYSVMKKDKKNQAGNIKFVLMKSVGEFVMDVGAERLKVKSAFQKSFEFFGSSLK